MSLGTVTRIFGQRHFVISSDDDFVSIRDVVQKDFLLLINAFFVLKVKITVGMQPSPIGCLV
jgi:hypothetical protein